MSGSEDGARSDQNCTDEASGFIGATGCCKGNRCVDREIDASHKPHSQSGLSSLDCAA